MSATPAHALSAALLSPRPSVDDLTTCMSGLRLDTNALYDQVSRQIAMPVSRTEEVEKLGPRGLALLMCHVPGATWRHFTNAFTNQALMRSFLQHFVELNENMVRQLKQMGVTVQTTFKNAHAGELAARILKSDRPVPCDQLWDLIQGISPNIAYYYLSEFADADRGSSPLNRNGAPFPMHQKVMLEVFVEEAYRTHLALIASGKIKELQTAPALEFTLQQQRQQTVGKSESKGMLASLASIPSSLMELLSASKQQQAADAAAAATSPDAGILRHPVSSQHQHDDAEHKHQARRHSGGDRDRSLPPTPTPTPSHTYHSQSQTRDDMEVDSLLGGPASTRAAAAPSAPYSASMGPSGAGLVTVGRGSMSLPSAAASVPPTPSTQTLAQAPTKWFAQLSALKSAGLSTSIQDVHRNVALLEQFNGNLEQVANAILAQQSGEPVKQPVKLEPTTPTLISHQPASISTTSSLYPSLARAAAAPATTPATTTSRVKQEKRVCGYPCQTGSRSQKGQPCQNPLADGEVICGRHAKIVNRCSVKDCTEHKALGLEVCQKHAAPATATAATFAAPQRDPLADLLLGGRPLQMRSSLATARERSLASPHYMASPLATTAVY